MAKIEEVFDLNLNSDKKVDKVIQDDNLDYIHMRFAKDEGLPIHISNSNVYMTVLKGTLSIGLDDQEVLTYASGSLLKIPFKTRMDVRNLNEELLELIVVKAPAPSTFKQK
ncbi:cupin domain-containing protein [Chloroflexota bacterium]|nr:cupin domain-containing protein [Chloroflexota bacterium]